ncbi:MAG: hypothetical protein Q9180_000803 [Flavoplaca navasiana]
MAWPGFDVFNNGPPVPMNDRLGRRGRGQHMYWTDGSGMLIPQAGPAVGRSNSVSGPRPAHIVINNANSRSRRSSHGHHSPPFDDDDSWDERAHSHSRHRDRSRARSRNRSRSRSRSRSRERSRERHRRHSHSRHHHESRSPSPYWDLETQRKMQKLEELERKEQEEAARERHKQEMLIAEAKKAAKKKEEEEFRKRVIEDAKREEYEKELKEKKKKEEEDKMFKARLKDMYLAQGYSEESIETMIKDAEKKRKGSHGQHSPHSPHALVGGHDGAMVHIQKEMNVVNLSRPTYLRVHRNYLSPDTLDAYDLPWEWDERDSHYIIIKRWISENDQDKLFDHTRKLREQREQRQQKLLTSAPVPVELKKDPNGKMKLVREKSPLGRSRSRPRSWMFT